MTSWAESERRLQAADPKFEGWKPSQEDAHIGWQDPDLKRILLFFPTGEGKSVTGLALLAERGYTEALVIAPPKTHSGWIRTAQVLGMSIQVISVESFRSSTFKAKRGIPWIVDEVHKLGERGREGFKKIERMMRNFDLELIGMSATPSYNKPERAFTLDVLFDQKPIRNYMDWIVANCQTQKNMFAYYPDVVGFLKFSSTQDYLASKPWVFYVEDTADWKKEQLKLPDTDLDVFERYGYSRRHKRVVASIMEKDHKRVELRFIDEKGLIRHPVWSSVCITLNRNVDYATWMIVCAHKIVAHALLRTFEVARASEVWLIDGDTKDIDPIKDQFIRSRAGILIGTTALAEGVDGLDKTCQAMLILDDIVGDDSKRRQIIGRILPRGTDDGIERLVVRATFD